MSTKDITGSDPEAGITEAAMIALSNVLQRLTVSGLWRLSSPIVPVLGPPQSATDIRSGGYQTACPSSLEGHARPLALS